MRKGILLAGGKGTRLYPLTATINKHLLPIYNKPMIYYPLCTLMQAGVNEIMLITNPGDIPLYRTLIGDGSRFGIRITYAPQEKADGIAQAFLIARDYLNGAPSMLMLGDNIFTGATLPQQLTAANNTTDRATIFAYRVADPERYGVVDFDATNKAVSIEEKPVRPKSSYAVTGIYFYDGDASKRSATLKPSPRGELEITDLNNDYLKDDLLDVAVMPPGVAWLDTGTFTSLLQASSFIETVETRQGLLLGSPEICAFENGWITRDQLKKNIEAIPKNPYRTALEQWLA